jgi:hypothetical protein
MKNNLLKTALLGCIALFAAFTTWTGPSGHWTGVLPVPGQGDFPLSYNFKADGDKLTGTAVGPDGDVNIDDGKIDGKKFSFNVIVHDMSIPHSGVFYGDSIALDVDLNGTMVHTTLKPAN